MDQDPKEQLTEFDSLICDHRMQLLKAAIPYISRPRQRTLSFIIKFAELNSAIKLFSGKEDSLSICSAPAGEDTLPDMVHTLKQYCTPQEADLLDLIQNFTQSFGLYRQYQATEKDRSDSEKTGGGHTPFDILKNMMTPEQQGIFEMLHNSSHI